MKKITNLLNPGLTYTLISVFIGCSSSASASECFANGNTITSLRHYQVVELEANADNKRNILPVSGKIKNKSYHPLTGAAIIYLLDEGGSVVHVIETKVNTNQNLWYNQKGAFTTTTTNIEELGNLQHVNVELIEHSIAVL